MSLGVDGRHEGLCWTLVALTRDIESEVSLDVDGRHEGLCWALVALTRDIESEVSLDVEGRHEGVPRDLCPGLYKCAGGRPP